MIEVRVGGYRLQTHPLLAGCQTVSFKSWQACDVAGLPRNLFPFAFHTEIIRHREHAVHRIGVNPGLILVALIGNYSLERHLAVIHDDVNRRNGLHGITVEARLAENGAILGDADSIVHRREWQDLDLIIDARYAFDALHHVFSIVLERRPRHLTIQPDGAAVHAVNQIIEYSVVRQHNQLVTHFTSDPILPHTAHIGSTVGTVLIFIFVLGKTRYHRERQIHYDGANVHRNTFHNLLPHLWNPCTRATSRYWPGFTVCY